MSFLDELTDLVNVLAFTLICTVIDKLSLNRRYTLPENPYHIALGFGLERIYRFLESKGQTDKITKSPDINTEALCRPRILSPVAI